MRKFFPRILLFLSPFFIMIFLEIVVFPIDFFTFRAWEALSVHVMRPFLPGPFYPSRQLERTEVGDLGHHTPYAFERRVRWVTDEFGYRYEPRFGSADYDVVLIGDSNIVGSGLSQEDTLAAVLEDLTGRHVYPFATRSVNDFMHEDRFRNYKPRVVVFSRIEREIPALPRLAADPQSVSRMEKLLRGFDFFHDNEFLWPAFVTLDRLAKMTMYHSLRASFDRLFHDDRQIITAPNPQGRQLVFAEGAVANEPVSEDVLREAVDTLVLYRDFFENQGIRFVFLPIPNKENIYHEYLGTAAPDFLTRLGSALQERDVTVVDTQRAFDEVFAGRGDVLYQPDDSHWSPEGVRLTAGLLDSILESKGPEILDK